MVVQDEPATLECGRHHRQGLKFTIDTGVHRAWTIPVRTEFPLRNRRALSTTSLGESPLPLRFLVCHELGCVHARAVQPGYVGTVHSINRMGWA